MKWSHFGGFAVLLLSLTLTSAKSVNPTNENVTSGSEPATSTVQTLPIEGISQDSDPKVASEEPKPVSENKDDKSRRLNLDYGQLRQTVDGNIPEPIVISSQPITVNRRESAGSMGNKRGRSMPEDGTREIEGIRVPDNEEDKFHTWRNARVIKGMLVPNGRSPQPHKKRQIMVQDATQYLASHGLTVPQFQQLYQQQQQQQQSGGLDAAALAQVGQVAAASQQQNVFYAPQPQVAQQQQFYAQDLNTGAIYATAAPLTAQHHFTASPIPIQTVTATPVVFQSDGQMYSGGNRFPVNTQFHARTGVEIQSAAPSVENSQLQPVAKPQVSIYSPSSPKQPETPVTRVEFQPMPDVETDQSKTPQQTQNSGQTQGDQQQAATSSIILQQGASTLIQTQQPTQQQQQQPSTQLIQIQQQQQQQLEAQASQQVAQIVQAHQQQQQQQQQQQLTAQVLQVHQQQHQLHQLQSLDSQRQQIPQQVIQLQPQQHQQHDQIHAATMIQQVPGQPTAYILQPSPSMAPNMIEDRNSPAYPHTANNRYVIKPQTYVAGPGGQVFTVPVPIPADEEEDEQHHQQNHRRREGDESPPKRERAGSVLMHKVMDAFQVNKNTIERVETNVALPVLATAGVLFGLGALAAAWYLSSQNREVGFLRRTGKQPVSTVGGVNLKRARRQAAEVDQAGFFQSIIQHAIEKQQKEFEDTIEPAESSPAVLTIPTMTKHRQNKPSSAVHSRLDENEFSDKGSYGHATHSVKWKKPAKSHWLGSKQALNFAKVAIPAVVLGGAVLAIGALIFGWYISGSNREIAFLEPSAYSRKKRDLTTTSLSDSWVQRLLSSIHNNPYEANGGGGASSKNSLMSFVDPDQDTSKGNSFGFKSDLSHAVVAVSLASVAFLTMLALVLAWLFSENERAVNWLETGGVGFGGWPSHYRRARSLSTNSIGSGDDPGSTLNPGFLASILTDLDVSHSRIVKKLQETGYSHWQETPCAKRIFCDVMSTQSDDTIRAMEKRMVTFVSM